MTTAIMSRLQSLRDGVDGTVLLPDEPGYDEARAVWNAMFDRHPAVIVRCTSASDVSTAVRFGRENDLEIGVRCGGHSVVAHAVPEGGLMIDLSPMGGVRVDPARRRAYVQGGALLGALDRAAQVHGLATTAGNVSHTGVGGLTLGGGMGWLARQHGLACDNVVSYEVITATGELVRATEMENADLFWGLRGGGGNFGIVTEFEFQLHPVGTRALLVELTYALESAAPVLRRWLELNATAPRQATFTAAIGATESAFEPDDAPAELLATVGYVWVGDPEEGRSLLPAMRTLGRAVTERVEDMSYMHLQTRDDTVQGHALRRYWKGHYFTEFDDDAIDAFLRRGSSDESSRHLPAVSLQAYGGAIADVPDDDSAFSQRDTLVELVTAAKWEHPAEDDAWTAAVRRCAGSLQPLASGAYVNTLTDEGAVGVARAYPPAKLARLTALKDAYDPENVFHLNQNIAPSAAGRAG